MQTTQLSLIARRFTLATLTAAALLAAGYANATTITQGTAALPGNADIIYVQTFNANPDQVKVDSRVMQKVMSMAGADSQAGKAMHDAREARDQVSDEIVRQLRAKGLNAVRLDGAVPAGANALVVTGQFDKIDEGNLRRRMVVGLGAGKSDVGASVELVYQPANGPAVAVQDFHASADSGHMPGVAETAGVGAVAGHVAMSAAAGGAAHGVSELQHDSVYNDATRLADAIAKQVAQSAQSAQRPLS
ncbi:protein of unknown function [Cupriavidus sp. OV038]|jgi:hypothetical protein|uniref:DUF4410 domain-containing protein n=1 Tax=unclassified Cupriavidus TaxID=2640874 RepID=UPI0008EBBF9B|nr:MULTISPECIES: DUF4410 domain-containing protein [unclassified Cupriavidus]SFC45080.1 protein of unknown function [Cupriavidus sp. OV038]SFP33349.1 protein of unknown function [Cupriavidus sp. OV096]